MWTLFDLSLNELKNMFTRQAYTSIVLGSWGYGNWSCPQCKPTDSKGFLGFPRQ